MCPHCFDYIAHEYQKHCDQCGTALSAGFWREFHEEKKRLFKIDDDDFVMEPDWERELRFWDDINLCCDKDYHECTCALSIPADEVSQVDIDQAYDEDSDCYHCVFVDSAACPPLRALAKLQATLYEDKLPSNTKPITPCKKFTLLDIPFAQV